jgi:PAS domain S-box-containing protein
VPTQTQWVGTAERQRLLTEALRDTAAVLTSTLNQDEVLDRILSHVVSVVPHDAANVMLIEDGFGRIVRQRGYEAYGLVGKLLIADLPDLQWVVENRKPFVIPDTHAYTAWSNLPQVTWVRSHISVPIIIQEEVIGFLNLDDNEPYTFTVNQGEYIQMFADQAAIAIRNARLYDEVRRQASELEWRVAERTRELEREQAQLTAILDGMSEGVIYDEMFQVRYINQALTRLTGYRFEEWEGFLEPLLPDAVTAAKFRAILNEIYDCVACEGIYRGEMRLRRKNGSEFDASLTATAVLGSENKVIGAVTVIRDISQEKALQQQKTQLVTYASHELRTPIANLMTRLYLLRHQPERTREHLAVLEEVSGRMGRLVGDLLEVSRLENGIIPLHRRDVVLQNLLDTVIHLQQPEADKKQITLELDATAVPLLVSADPDRFIQVLTNLLINAIHYTPAGGRIFLCLRAEDNQAVIEVEDNGIGIAAEHLPYIFQPFFRASQTMTEGTGLGLNITQKIVTMHGGSITVRSEIGHGSCFTVRLALLRSAADSTSAL